MDNLQEIIGILSQDDKKGFRRFINRQKKLDQRKDLELFELLDRTEKYTSKEILGKLYETPNPTAYHALRKRLIKKLMEYITLKRMEADTTSASSIMSIISLAGYLLDHKAERLAWFYLKKAEKLAHSNEQFDLLNTLYNVQIENSQSEYALPLNDIIKRKEANQQLALEDERVTIAYSLIKERLQQIILEGQEIDFEAVIQTILRQYQLHDAVIQRPKLLYNVLSITRSAILAKKDFYTFEPYIIRHYREAKFSFSKSNHFYKLSIIYMIAHVLYRNRKFKASAVYLDEMQEDLLAFNRSHYVRFYAKYTLLRAAVNCYIGKISEGVGLLEEELQRKDSIFNVKDQIEMRLNLCFYYFLQGRFGDAVKLNLEMGKTEKWLEKNMGREWVMKRSIMEVIAHYELQNRDLVSSRIRSIERNFANIFKHPLYQRGRAFLNLMKILIDRPKEAISETFKSQAETALITIPEEQEDLQAMAFYAWLKSKMLDQNYYEVLLDTVKPEVDLAS
ncbi:MAG: hypothetical protein ACR2MX_09105 [Cyclobacteriaceae bacterium]